MRVMMTLYGMSDEVYFLYYYALVRKFKLRVVSRSYNSCTVQIYKKADETTLKARYTLWGSPSPFAYKIV